MDPGLATGKIFDPRFSPVAVDNLAFYGDVEVKIWFHTSGQLWKEMTDFAVAAEWNDLKACIKRTNFRPLDTLTLWQRMFTDFEEQFHILMLMEIILILPLAGVTVE